MFYPWLSSYSNVYFLITAFAAKGWENNHFRIPIDGYLKGRIVSNFRHIASSICSPWVTSLSRKKCIFVIHDFWRFLEYLLRRIWFCGCCGYLYSVCALLVFTTASYGRVQVWEYGISRDGRLTQLIGLIPCWLLSHYIASILGW